MADGFAALQAQIARLRGLGVMAKEAAPEVAEAIAVELRGKAAAGVSPDGAPWAPTKAGGAPLRGAAGNLRVSNVGGSILIRITGPDAMHSTGRGRGKVVRRVVPTEISDGMGRAIQSTLTDWFHKAMK